ncbi:MAG TPA: AMP-binding protein [Candidatus Copromorpha excrementigallinarum]|uniref:AMP-binding protein n=1 Tax=Candidatus Allocopromorpha excrementigallinarum TaxID=2840742 RepID=A0A9D1HZ32_9FIRM|nr:AMP-binding protein [Candidatus Copromorpha excrementigallinarum]
MNSRKYRNVFYNTRDIKDLRDLVHSSAELYGDDSAFLVKDKPSGAYRGISYRQFEEDVDSLGTELLNMGLKGEKVALIGENSYQWVVTYLAVTNGTGVIVPLDKELPETEIRNLIERAEAGALVFSEKTADRLAGILEDENAPRIKIKIGEGHCTEGIYSWSDILERGRAAVEKGNREFTDAIIDREAMCSLLFTSGTTGSSKGVMLSHKNISANVVNMSKYVKIRRPGGGLSVLPMHHTYELTCHVFTAVYQGVFVAICEGLRYIQQNLKESEASVMVGVPAVFEAMHKKVWKQAEASGFASKMKKAMDVSRRLKLYNRQGVMRTVFSKIHRSLGNNISLFISGGAAINPDVIRDYEALGIPMIQGYGMTENAPIIAVNRDYYSKADSVGKPMPGTQIRILDPDEDGIGEIICRGPSVMIGYYKDPEATAEAIKDGWLYTGDYGKFDSEGFLYICGRKKNVIVTKNGKNIFPEEIEQLLLESPFIEEVVVYGALNKGDGGILVKAEIYPDFEEVEEKLGNRDSEEVKALIKDEIEKVNDIMPVYKRVKRFKIRNTEFEKTTTRKIRRLGSGVKEEED